MTAQVYKALRVCEVWVVFNTVTSKPFTDGSATGRARIWPDEETAKGAAEQLNRYESQGNKDDRF